MSANAKNTKVIGVTVAACAVCCAGPVVGVLAAIGLGTAAGFALFGTIAILIGAAAMTVVLVRRRRIATCMPADASASVRIELTEMRTPS